MQTMMHATFALALVTVTLCFGTAKPAAASPVSSVSYKHMIHRKETECTAETCEIELSLVSITADTIVFPFSDGTVPTPFTNSDKNSEQGHWNGEKGFSYLNLLKKGKGSQGNDLWFGNAFDHDNNIYYSIAPDANGTSIIATTKKASEFLLEHGLDPTDRPAENTTRMLDSSSSSERSSNRQLVDDGSVIDVMFVWTKLAECQASFLSSGCLLTAQTETNIRGKLDLVIAETNTAYTNSGILTQLRLVYAYRHPMYVETNCLSALYQVSSETDGIIDDVHTYRSQYGADMVQLFTGACEYCGIAWIGPGKKNMFSVVNINCLQLTPAHEWGHNQGCYHDRGTDNRCTAGGYNYGYRNPRAQFGDIMSYDCWSCSCNYNCGWACPRIARMANTVIPYNGYAVGDASNNCARTINDNRVKIANYYQTKPPTPKPTTAKPVTAKPTKKPTTKKPTTHEPTKKPTTQEPTQNPTTHAPTLSKKPITHAPTKKPLLGVADSSGIACGGAVAVAANAIIYSSIVTTGAFSTGDSSSVFGDVDCGGAACLGANANFNGTLISQAGVVIGENVKVLEGIFTGDILSAAAVTVGSRAKIVGNIYACTAVTLGAGGSVTGQVLQAANGLRIPSSNGTKVLADIVKAYTYLKSQPGAKDLESSIINNALLPGIYFQATAWTFGAGRTLTFNGTSSDTWIIQLEKAAAIAGNIYNVGALPSNIQWAVAGALSIGAGCNFCGYIISPSAISVGTGATLNGGIYSSSGACSLGDGARLVKSKAITAKPPTKRSVTAKPTNAKPVTTKPTTKRPVTAKPTNAKPVTTKPTTKRPVTAKPTEKPTSKKPTTHEPTQNPTTHAPTLTKKPITVVPTKKPLLGVANNLGIACGGAVAIAANAIVYSSIVTASTFSTGDSSTVFGDIDCYGAASLGANANFNGTLISQAGVALGVNVKVPGGIFTGDILSTAAVTVGSRGKIVGNIYACSALTLGAECSVTGQALQGAAAFHVPSSNGTKALADIDKAYTYLKSQPGAKDLETSIINNALLPGIYFQATAWTFGAGRTLTFNGTSSDTWIIQLGGAAAIAGNIYNVGALPSNIQWAVAGSLSIGAGCNFCGYIISPSSISLGNEATLNGGIYSPSGSCSLGDGARLTKIKQK